MWLLAGTSSDRTIQDINLLNGHVVHLLAVSGDAAAIAESATGTLAVGYANTAGTVEFRDGTSGSVIATTHVGQPVKQLVAQGTSPNFFVLDGTPTATTVNSLDPTGAAPVPAIGVSLSTISLAVSPDGAQLYLLQSSGQVIDMPVPTGSTPLASSGFFGGVGAVRIAISPDGARLFVLKSLRRACNVGVFDLATQEQTGVVAAPSESVGVVPSLDGEHLYVLVGTASVGNVQVISVG